MNPEEQKQVQEAKEYVRRHQKELIQKYADPSIYKSVSQPVSLFMGGSPGAGKTEVSKNLISKFKDIPVRIDADEIRKDCPGYQGSNAHLFQDAAVKGINLLLDHALSKKLNFILDGTFAYGDAKNNIQRSLDKGRIVELWFVYQDPTLAWEFTKVREAVESRRVSKEIFISSFFKSRLNAIEAKKYFQSQIDLNLLIKNIDNTDGTFKLNIQADELDRYIGRVYTESELNQLLA